jgi:hypothetical protein
MNGDLSGANALRLMGALVKSGAQADVPIANARVSDVAVQAGENPGWTRITEAGISAGQGNG